MRKSRIFLFVLLLIVTISVLFFLNGSKGKKEATPATTFDVIDEAYEIIQKRGVYPVKGDELIEGALRGMADVIGDPYSTYLTAGEAAAHRESLASERIGIGAEITRSNGKFIIVAPLKSSPADKAGLRPYDEIIQLDGERIEGETLQGVVKRIRGKQGTTLKMTIFRPDENKHLEISITRDAIPVTTVAHELMAVKKQKVGYISITTFGEDTAKEWQVATDALLAGGAEAIMIDVRGNPGGYLHSVSEIAGSILPADTVFAYMEDGDGALSPLVAEKSEEIQFNEQLKKTPLILLQDEGSASASEVLSGALKDLKRSVIIGTQSFGKGTVQETIDLTNGGEVKLSTHKWLTPKEIWIHGKGVEVDLAVEQNSLFNEHIRLVTETYKEGDYHDDISYAQRLLQGLGYKVKRNDGYFDEQTAQAIEIFRKDAKVKVSEKMDREFFVALKTQVEIFREDRKNDAQLKMAIDYLAHELKVK